ncbi:MAG: glycine betaine ABC transporter substrate-binding protein, partial [Chloroflexota bacterium]
MFRSRPFLVRIVLVSLFLFTNIGIVNSQSDDENSTDTTPIIVSSKSYTESLILGKIMALLLQEAGYNVDDQTGYPSADARDALERGEIHVYPEMAGTALALYHNLPTDALPTEGDRSHALAKQLDESQGIIWLTPTGYVLTTALVVRPDLWEAGLRTYSDLAAYMSDTEPNLRLCMIDIILERPRDGLKALEEAYGFQFPIENVLALPVTENLPALRAGQCDVATSTSTDGRISSWGYHSLEDDKAFYPLYVPAPTIRQQIIAENPEVADILSSFGQYLDLATIHSLNARVDIGADGVADSGDEETPEAVALSFLRSIGLLETPPIVVSSKSYSESLILGKIMALLLREAGYNVDDQTGYPSAEARDA